MRHKILVTIVIFTLIGGTLQEDKPGYTEDDDDESKSGPAKTTTEEEGVKEVVREDSDVFRGSAIKIIAAPDLSKTDKSKWKGDGGEEGDMDDITSQLLKEQSRWLRKMIAQVEGAQDLLLSEEEETRSEEEEEEEQEEISPEVPEETKELTLEEKEAIEMFEKALTILNASRPNKVEAYELLKKAAQMGHNQARVKVAWASLFGSTLKQDIPAAKLAFEEMAELGVPDAHMLFVRCPHTPFPLYNDNTLTSEALSQYSMIFPLLARTPSPLQTNIGSARFLSALTGERTS
uniref:Uncharacterized protein n=1 Tax=Timema poppense TaxID=170557 RepID=A0A7R9GUP0_TIMPO|nr:unnamed protein product [Timema poppensis]